MNQIIRFFSFMDFLKYPFFLTALYYSLQPIIDESVDMVQAFNNGLILLGVGMSIDALRDPKKLSNLQKRIYTNPKIAKYYFIGEALIIFSGIFIGVIGYFIASESALKELSVGFITSGIGFMSYLKSGMEISKSFAEQEKAFL